MARKVVGESRRIRAEIAFGMALASVLWAVGGATAATGDAQLGEQIFRKTCFACHTVGGGRLVGPDLRGVSGRRSEQWIIAFVQDSPAVIKGGDAEAVALFEQFNQIPMPAQALTDDEVRAVIAFLHEGTVLGPAQQEVAEQFTPEQVRLGQNLFEGRTRLSNGGPSCNSCHEVINDAVIGGGILARDLTTVFSRLGGPGVRAILGGSPFPVMQLAFRDRPLTEIEVAALVGFLQQADAEHAFHQPRDYGIKLVAAGAVGAALLLGLYSLAWRRRKASLRLPSRSSIARSSPRERTRSRPPRITEPEPEKSRSIHGLDSGHHLAADAQVGGVLPQPLPARSHRPQHPRRELHRGLLVADPRQGRHRHLGDAAARLSAARGLPAAVRAARLPARHLLLLVPLQPAAHQVPADSQRAARRLPREEERDAATR